MLKILRSLITFFLLFLITSIFLIMIDRYGFFKRDKFFYNYVDLYEKINLGLKKNSKTIVLGTSRPYLSFNPDYTDKNIFNSATHVMLPEHYIYAVNTYTQNLNVTEFIIFLDFFTANQNLKRTNNFKLYNCLYKKKSFCKFKDLISLYYNWSNILSSVKLIFSSNKTNLYIEDNGFLKSSNYAKIYSKMSRKNWFKRVENDYERRIFNDASFNFDKNSNYVNFLNFLCKVKTKKNIKFTLAIPPVHKKMLEIIYNNKLNKNYIDWKKSLILVNKKCNIDIYDFTNVNLEDDEFYEISHIRENYMNKIQDVIINYKFNIPFTMNEEIVSNSVLLF
tara:strand:+ start:37 stop:1041 length:1005 start_codon:yes stop_codon:yes gene_type:complete